MFVERGTHDCQNNFNVLAHQVFIMIVKVVTVTSHSSPKITYRISRVHLNAFRYAIGPIISNRDMHMWVETLHACVKQNYNINDFSDNRIILKTAFASYFF